MSRARQPAGSLILGRSFIQNDDPKPTADEIERTLKIYPYVPGTLGTSIAEILTGTVQAGTPGGGREDGLRRGHRQGDEHDPAERLRLL